jgi:hypothetical protein
MQANCFMFVVFAGSILFYRLHIGERHKLLLIGFFGLAVPIGIWIRGHGGTRCPARALSSRSNSAFFVIALLIWAKVYLKNDSIDHTRITSDSGMGRSVDSGASQ